MATALQILRETLIQFLSFFGVLFVSGFFLTLISKWTNNTFRQFLYPRFGLYAFGVIGVPLHELCHALFAKAFLHKIEKIKWFDPQGKGGSYGTVVHTYNDRNPYHRIGLFFIGMGPVLLAPLILYLLYLWLIPGALGLQSLPSQPLALARDFLGSLLHSSNWTSWQFYVFLYLSVCLTSQMELSPDDFKIARGGILPFFLLLVLINSLSFWAQFHFHSRWMGAITSLATLWSLFFMVGLLLALANLILCYCLFNLTHKLFGRESINPFRS